MDLQPQEQVDALASLDKELEMTAVERLRGNPKTSIIGLILGSAATAASSGMIPEPYGQITILASSLLASIALLVAQD